MTSTKESTNTGSYVTLMRLKGRLESALVLYCREAMLGQPLAVRRHLGITFLGHGMSNICSLFQPFSLDIVALHIPSGNLT